MKMRKEEADQCILPKCKACGEIDFCGHKCLPLWTAAFDPVDQTKKEPRRPFGLHRLSMPALSLLPRSVALFVIVQRPAKHHGLEHQRERAKRGIAIEIRAADAKSAAAKFADEVDPYWEYPFLASGNGLIVQVVSASGNSSRWRVFGESVPQYWAEPAD